MELYSSPFFFETTLHLNVPWSVIGGVWSNARGHVENITVCIVHLSVSTPLGGHGYLIQNLASRVGAFNLTLFFNVECEYNVG